MRKMSGLTIRTAGPPDQEALREHVLGMAMETESIRLDPAIVDAGLRKALADPEGTGTYLVAERDSDGQVVGSLMVSKEWSDWRGQWYWWIQSVYVDPTARRSGVYRALHEDVRRRARIAGDVYAIRLYVETRNERAQATYASLGMAREEYLVYKEVIEQEDGDVDGLDASPAWRASPSETTS